MERPPPSFPERLGRYEILLPIASGGMATVYLARVRGALGFEREVALKSMHPHLRADAAESADALIAEAKLVARIRHPNVVSVLDVGDDAEGIFLVMDYVEGETLSAILRDAAAASTTLPMPIALRVLSDVLAGLHAAHELRTESGESIGIVHRDFSPQNILVGTDGTTKLTDFGIAKAMTHDAHTQTGMVKGKVGYMAPEQALGRALDRRCDVWAAGVVAWEIFAGRRLFPPGVDAIATAVKIATGRPPRLSEERPDAPPALVEAIASALEPSVAERCPSADELKRRILAACEPTRPADASEVAAHVQRIASPRLLRWKQQIEEILALRARMGEVVEAATEATRTVVTPTGPRLMPAETAAAIEEPTRDASPTVLPPEALTEEAMTAVRVTGEGSAPLELAPPRGSRPLRVALVAIAVSALIAGLFVVRGRASSALVANDNDATKPAESAPSEVKVVASVTPSASGPRAELAILADAPIAQVRVGDRLIAIASPTRSLTVQLDPSERGAATLEIIAADGRRVSVRSSDADVRVEFPAPSSRATKHAPAAASKPAESKTSEALLPSPYEKK